VIERTGRYTGFPRNGVSVFEFEQVRISIFETCFDNKHKSRDLNHDGDGNKHNKIFQFS